MRAVLLPLVLTISACSLDRGGLSTDPIDGGPIDTGLIDPPDAHGPDDDAGACTGPDQDGDGIADVCDSCPEGRNDADLDGDTVPDACDPWPCGAEAPAVPGSVSAEGIVISDVMIGVDRNTAVVRAGQSFDVMLRYAITDECRDCIDQVEIGIAPGDRVGCVYDDDPPREGDTGSATLPIVAPTAPGLADLRFNLGQRYGCTQDGASTWWLDPPEADHTFAVICVVP